MEVIRKLSSQRTFKIGPLLFLLFIWWWLLVQYYPTQIFGAPSTPMEKWLAEWDQKNSGTLPESCEQNCTIPKSIPPAQYPKTGTKIPKIIWQTFKSNRLPTIFYQSVKTCLEQNPEYHYRFFDDNDIAEFIKFWNEEIQRTLCVLNVGAAKADLWRSLVVYEYGGIYLDMDSACIVPFDQWVLPEDDVVTGVGGRGDPHQWFLAYSPHHLFLKVDIVKIVQRVFKFEKKPDDHHKSMEHLTGPPVLHKAWGHVLQQSPNPKCQTIFSDIKNQTSVEGVFYECGEVGRLHLFSKDQAGGNVKFKGNGLGNAMAQLGTIWGHVDKKKILQPSRCAPFPDNFDFEADPLKTSHLYFNQVVQSP